MKKLGKLSINPEKVITNEELVNLKGGYTTCCRPEGKTALCSSDENLLAAYCDVWEGGFGIDCNCNYEYYV